MDEIFQDRGRGRTLKSKTRDILKKRLPILKWMPKYRKGYILPDIIAGITVWLTAVPQSLAYAGIAGLTPEYGLYSQFLGPFVYIVLGSCRQMTIGPTAIVQLFTYQKCGEDFPECVVLMGFYSGIVELFLGILQLGFLVSFISEPVTIAHHPQIFYVEPGRHCPWSYMSCGARYVEDTERCTPANEFRKPTSVEEVILGSVRSGFPPVGLPQFELYNPNGNSTVPMTPIETLQFLGTGPLVVAFGAILQNIAISKAFGHGQTVDATQEMLATGVTNAIGGFFSSIPTSGSFARSAINDASGVKSPLGGMVTGVMILLSLGYLTPFFQFIPKASLAAVIICAVVFLIEVESISLMWRTSKLDFLCCTVTIAASLGLGIEYGILVGVSVSLAILLLNSLRPSMTPEFKIDPETNVHFVLLKPDQGINFPSVDYIRDSVNHIARHYDNYSIIVIQCDKWTRWDFTAANALVFLTKAMSKRGISLVFYKCRPEWYQLLETFGLKDPPCCFHKEDLEDYFMQMEPELSTSSVCNVTANPQDETSDDEGNMLLESSRSFPNYYNFD
ncbi:unnamed protein product [Allacma fusca]|uniref:STAS domain-containing protein n=1 Tax=Allacma fusca TaxID=39272 RepID=A0A8J2P7D0_9HEXA|nr:unnamed protein product [Allacma fusca]